MRQGGEEEESLALTHIQNNNVTTQHVKKQAESLVRLPLQSVHCVECVLSRLPCDREEWESQQIEAFVVPRKWVHH